VQGIVKTGILKRMTLTEPRISKRGRKEIEKSIKEKECRGVQEESKRGDIRDFATMC
jgi:hypothetical protein